MSFSQLLNLLIELIPATIIFLVLYFTDRIFNYKTKIIHIIGSVRIYKIMLITSMVLLILFTGYRISDNPVTSSIFFAYMYLVQIPKEHR